MLMISKFHHAQLSKQTCSQHAILSAATPRSTNAVTTEPHSEILRHPRLDAKWLRILFRQNTSFHFLAKCFPDCSNSHPKTLCVLLSCVSLAKAKALIQLHTNKSYSSKNIRTCVSLHLLHVYSALAAIVINLWCVIHYLAHDRPARHLSSVAKSALDASIASP